MSKVIFVTGAGRGLGTDIAREALSAGHQVVTTGRRPEEVEKTLGGPQDNLLATKLDVTSLDDAQAAAQAAVDRFGRIDVLINNAGNFFAGFFEEIPPAHMRQQIETNLFGPMNVTRAILPVMRRQRAGHVITISSSAGVVGGEFTVAYATSKFGVEGWMESVRYDVAPYNIRTTIVEPGYFRTELLVDASTTWPEASIDDYAERTASTIEAWKAINGQQPGDPAKLAQALLTIANQEQPPLRFVAGADAIEAVEAKANELLAQAAASRELAATWHTTTPKPEPPLRLDEDVTPVGGPARRVMALAALMFAGFSFVTVEIAPVGLLPAISADLGVSLSAVGLLVTFYGLTVAVASIPLTRLVGPMPRRYLLSGLLAVFVASTCLSVAGPSYWALTAGRVATALSQAVFWSVAAPAAVAMFSPQVRGRVTSALFAAPALATVLGVPAVTWLGQQAGWRAAFLAVAGLGLLALLGIATLIPTTRPEESHSAVGSAPHERRFRAIIAATALAVTGVFAAFTYLAPFLTEVSGFSTAAISPLLLLFGVAGVVGVGVGGGLVDRWPQPAVFVPVLLLTLALIGLYAFGTHQGVVLALIPLFGFAVAQAPSIFQARLLDVAPGNTDVASAWFSSAYNLGIAAGALTGGLLLPLTGVRSTYLIGAVLTALALAVLASTHIPFRKTRP